MGHLEELTKARQARTEAYNNLQDAQTRWGLERARIVEERDQSLEQIKSIAAGSDEVNRNLVKLSEANNQLRRERDALAVRAASLQSAVDGLEQEGSDSHRAHAELIRERDALRVERDGLASAQTRLKGQLGTAEQQASEVRAELHTARTRALEWSSDYEALRRERDALREERNRLAEKQIPLLQDRDQLRQELGPMRISRDQANQALEASRSRIQQLRHELEAERARTLELEVQLEQREPLEIEWDGPDVEAQTRRMLAEARVAHERLQSELDAQKTSVADLARLRDTAQEANRELQRRLAAAELEANEARKQQIQDLDWFMETLRAVRSNGT